MAQHDYSIEQIQWQEQLNGYSLLGMKISLAPDENRTLNEFICAKFVLNDNRLYLFAAQPLAENQWQLQFLNDSQWPINNDESLQIQWSNLTLPAADDKLLMLGEGLQMAPIFALAKLRQTSTNTRSDLVLLHASTSFPFAIKPARFMVETTPPEAIGACALLEDWKIANRLCSEQFIGGCAQMSLCEMLQEWLQAMQCICQQHPQQNSAWHLVISAGDDSIQQCNALIKQSLTDENPLQVFVTRLGSVDNSE